MPECAFHPGVEATLRCAECDRYICPKDMVSTPVGYKCRECGIARRPKLGGVRPAQLAGGIGAAVGAGILGGAALMFVPYHSWLLAIVFGLAVGWVTQRGAGGHKGGVFAGTAAASAGLGGFLGGLGLVGGLIAGVAAAYYLSQNRL